MCVLRAAVEVGLPEGYLTELEEILLGEFFRAVRRALTDELPVRVSPMRGMSKQGADRTQVKVMPGA